MKHVLYAWTIIPMKKQISNPYDFLLVVIRYVRNVLKNKYRMLGVVSADRKERREFNLYHKEIQEFNTLAKWKQ